MRKLIMRLSIAAAAMAISVTSSWADTYTVQYWNFNGSPFFGPDTLASETNPYIVANPTPDAQFTYSGPIDWFTDVNPAIVGTFIANAPGGTINPLSYSNPSGNSAFATLAQFLAATLSTAGDSTTSFFRISGSGFLTGATITHDDGVSFYLADGGVLSQVLNSQNETSQITDTFSVAAGNHSFVLDYVEGNGTPAVLNFTAAVPEVSTWLMMLLGFASLGFLGYRRAPKALSMA